MTLIAGASQYVNQAILATRQGSSYAAPDVLSESGLGGDLLSIGRANSVPGIGISNYARAMNDAALKKSNQVYNGLFSATGAATASVDAAKTQINALRSRLPESQIAESLRGKTIDEQV